MPKKKILFVDDEKPLGQMIKLNLEQTGKYDVLLETKGANALEAAKKFKPEVIILDLIMPDLDGSEVAVQLQDNPPLKNIPIIFLTAISPKDRDDNYNIDKDWLVLSKPIPLEDLIAAIENFS